MPREITSFSNDTVKFLRSLRDKKARRATGMFLAEGLRILTEARGFLDRGLHLGRWRHDGPLLGSGGDRVRREAGNQALPPGGRHLDGKNAFGIARSPAVQPIAFDPAGKEWRYAIEVRREGDGLRVS